MAWMDDAISQLMMRMQLQQMMGGSQQRRQAYEAWQGQATPEERRDDADSFYDSMRNSNPGYAEGELMPYNEGQQRTVDSLIQEKLAGGGAQRDRDLSEALSLDRGRWPQIPEEYGYGRIYEPPFQNISDVRSAAPTAMSDPVSQLMLQMQLRGTPDWEPPVPPSLPPQDTLYQDTSRGSPAQNARRDMEIVATPRPPSENIDELIRSGQPGIADPRMLYSRSDLDNAQFNFAPGYLRKTAAGNGGGDPLSQLMMQMQLQQLMGGNRGPF